MTVSKNRIARPWRSWPWPLRALCGGVVLIGAGALATYLLRPDVLLRAEFARQAWQAGVSRHVIDVDDHRWVSFERGADSSDARVDAVAPLLLLHGFTGSKENYLPMLAALREPRRVLVPDLPGWGESSRLDTADYGIGAQVDRLEDFLDAHALARVHLAGHSMGGHIAGVFAARHPGRVASLTLIDSAGVRFEPNAFARRVQRGETPFNMGTRAEFDAFMGELFLEPPLLPPRLKDLLIERNVEGHDFHARVLASLGQGEAAFQLERSLDRIHAPTLVLWCREDRILDVSSTAVLARIRPAPTVRIVEGCGHMAMMERPVQFAEALRMHITRVDATSGTQRFAGRPRARAPVDSR